MIRAVVTDLEGTTTSIAFVHDVLFPYAARALDGFVRARGAEPDVKATLDELAAVGPGTDPVANARAAIAADRKLTPLKRLQGWIWEAGYADGTLVADVYADVAPRLRAWHAEGVALAVYSSGSVHAQRLLMGHTGAGDLRPLFTGWFDTETGAKTEAASYAAIARALACAPGDVLFLSDAPAELAAAAAAGVAVIGVAREGAATPAPWRWVASFAEIGLPSRSS